MTVVADRLRGTVALAIFCKTPIPLPTWQGTGATAISPEETIRIAITRR